MSAGLAGALAGALMITSGSAGAQEGAATEHEVFLGAAPTALAGTLTLPAGGGPYPGVVLVHGSGPHDRDESIGPNRPFRDLAAGLAARGIGVLRYEKRTRTYPMSYANRAFTVDDETVDDALAAVELLRATRQIDPRRIVIVGHSLGGMLAPRMAERDSTLAGIVLLAGATNESLLEMVERQMRHLRTLPGADTAALDRQTELLAPLMARIRALTPADSASTELLLGAPAAYWLDLHAYDPLATAARLSVPMLVLHGARDYQVSSAGFDAWREALAGRANVSFRLYPGLNHLFIAGEGPGGPSEYAVPGHVSDAVIGDIAEWIATLTPR